MIDKKLIVINNLIGINGEASVTITNATFQIINNSEKRYPDKDFGFWLVNQVKDNIIYLENTSSFYGIIKNKYYCPSCSIQLDPNLRQQKEKIIKLKYHEYEPFILQIRFPSIKCSKCEKEYGIDVNVPPRSLIYGAINNAFEPVA